MDDYKQENRRFFSFTVKDNNNLQVLQNKLNRLLLTADYNTPTEELLHQAGSLSVHQMVAYQTAVSSHTIVSSGKPLYIASKLRGRQLNMDTRHGESSVIQPSYGINLAKEGFIYRGAAIYNKLDVNLRKETKLEKFKAGAKEWVKANIPVKPKPHFKSISSSNNDNHPPPPPKPPPPSQNTITRYLVPLHKNQSTNSLTSTRRSSPKANPSKTKSIQYYFPPLNQTQSVPGRPVPAATSGPVGTTAEQKH